MARDQGLEALLSQDLQGERGLNEKAMFAGQACLLHGNLLCGARSDGLLVRLGKDKDAWALRIPGIVQMIMGERHMHGWVRVAPETCGDDALRRKLLDAALAFVRSLPKK